MFVGFNGMENAMNCSKWQCTVIWILMKDTILNMALLQGCYTAIWMLN